MTTLNEFNIALSELHAAVMSDEIDKDNNINNLYLTVKQCVDECPILLYSPLYRKTISKVHQLTHKLHH